MVDRAEAEAKSVYTQALAARQAGDFGNVRALLTRLKREYAGTRFYAENR